MRRRSAIGGLACALVLGLSGCGGSGGATSAHSVAEVEQAFASEGLPLVGTGETAGAAGEALRAKAPPAADPLQISVHVLESEDEAEKFEETASDPASQAFFSATGGKLTVLRQANVVVIYDTTPVPDRLPLVRAALDSLHG